jgi:hypothetical protein
VFDTVEIQTHDQARGTVGHVGTFSNLDHEGVEVDHCGKLPQGSGRRAKTWSAMASVTLLVVQCERSAMRVGAR